VAVTIGLAIVVDCGIAKWMALDFKADLTFGLGTVAFDYLAK
jgi:acetoacetate decarboxylase